MFSFIAAVIQKTGLLGVGLLMLIENLVPIIPSELIMPMAGFEAARGAFSPVAAVLVATVASIGGGAAWYWVGRGLGLERLQRWAAGGGRWLTLSPAELERGNAWFQRWGPAAVCVGRTLPAVRGVICIPAGVARMPFGSFLLWSSLGALLWSGLLLAAGYLLRDHYRQVERWLNPLTDAFLIACLAGYVVRIVHRRGER